MGTRHMIGVIANKKFCVAQYGQWDGYPSGQGISVLNFLRSLTPVGLSVFKEKCLAVNAGKNEEIEALCTGHDWTEKYPEFSCDTSVGIFNILMERDNGVILCVNSDFGKDSLWCAWAYIVNFDTGKLECYKGFNHRKLAKKERFYTEKPTYVAHDGKEYWGCRLLKEYSLKRLPSDETFIKALKE